MNLVIIPGVATKMQNALQHQRSRHCYSDGLSNPFRTPSLDSNKMLSTYSSRDSFSWAQNLSSPEGVWELMEMIGEGTYGEVYKGRHLGTGDIVAVKVMDAVLDKEEDIKAELSVFEKHSSHPNIVTFFGSYLKRDTIADDRIWLVMEYCSNGSVSDLVRAMHKKGACLSEDLIAFTLKEVLSGLSYLHSQHCMHRDVKGQNCMLTAQGHVKLVDFGVSAELKCALERRRSSVGTPYWMAPEVIACETQLDMDYDLRADIWSLGVTAIEIADGFPPFYGQHRLKVLTSIVLEPPPTLKQPEKWSPSLSDFVSRCLTKDFEKRPFARDLFKRYLIKHVPVCSGMQYQIKLLELVASYRGFQVEPQLAYSTAEGEIKQSSYGLKCSALFTRSSTPLISPVQYPPRAPGPNAATNVVAGPEVCGWGNRWGVDEDEGREGLKEVEALEEGRSSEEEEKEDSKQNVRAMEKEETLEESGSRGREVCGDRDKTKDDLHISSLTIIPVKPKGSFVKQRLEFFEMKSQAQNCNSFRH